MPIDSLKARTYDAIVIGSGISGGWAAKELTQNGLRTLLLERGRQVSHITAYPTATLNTWELEHRGQVPLQVRQDYSIASRNPFIFNRAGRRVSTEPYANEAVHTGATSAAMPRPFPGHSARAANYAVKEMKALRL